MVLLRLNDNVTPNAIRLHMAILSFERWVTMPQQRPSFRAPVDNSAMSPAHYRTQAGHRTSHIVSPTASRLWAPCRRPAQEQERG